MPSPIRPFAHSFPLSRNHKLQFYRHNLLSPSSPCPTWFTYTLVYSSLTKTCWLIPSAITTTRCLRDSPPRCHRRQRHIKNPGDTSTDRLKRTARIIWSRRNGRGNWRCPNSAEMDLFPHEPDECAICAVLVSAPKVRTHELEASLAIVTRKPRSLKTIRWISFFSWM